VPEIAILSVAAATIASFVLSSTYYALCCSKAMLAG
jgi:hypothetical protein